MTTIHSEISSPTYQLDCIGGVLPACSRATFLELWNEHFLKNDADRAALGQWAQLRQRYDRSFEMPSPIELPLGKVGGRVALASRIRIAGLLASSIDDYRDRLTLLGVLPADRAALKIFVVDQACDDAVAEHGRDRLVEQAIGGSVDAGTAATIRAAKGTKVVVVKQKSVRALVRAELLDEEDAKAIAKAKSTPLIYTRASGAEKMHVIVTSDEAGARTAFDALAAAKTWRDAVYVLH